MAKLIIFSAPSGSGKSTIINYLLTQKSELGILHLSDQPPAPRNGERWSGVFLSDS